jgi:hypothetical protein
MRWMAALVALGLAACAAEQPPTPPPSLSERASVQNRRRPVVRARATPPANALARLPEEAPAARPSEATEAQTRQERDRQAFVVCSERSNGGPGVEAVAACLQAYGSTGVVPGD